MQQPRYSPALPTAGLRPQMSRPNNPFSNVSRTKELHMLWMNHKCIGIMIRNIWIHHFLKKAFRLLRGRNSWNSIELHPLLMRSHILPSTHSHRQCSWSFSQCTLPHMHIDTRVLRPACEQPANPFCTNVSVEICLDFTAWGTFKWAMHFFNNKI